MSKSLRTPSSATPTDIIIMRPNIMIATEVALTAAIVTMAIGCPTSGLETTIAIGHGTDVIGPGMDVITREMDATIVPTPVDDGATMGVGIVPALVDAFTLIT